MSAWNVFIPDATLRSLTQTNEDTTGALHVYIKDMKRIPQDMELLRDAFSAAGFILMDREAKPFWEKFQSVNREDWTGQSSISRLGMRKSLSSNGRSRRSMD